MEAGNILKPMLARGELHLQLLDDGRLTDSQGRTVNFSNTVVIMTSNLGSQDLLKGISETGQLDNEIRERVLNRLNEHFKPEFLNRIDEIVLFKPLGMEEIIKIIDITLSHLVQKLVERKIHLSFTQGAKEHMAKVAYSATYGARPVKRYIQKNIETQIARKIIGGTLVEGSKIEVDLDGEDLAFKTYE